MEVLFGRFLIATLGAAILTVMVWFAIVIRRQIYKIKLPWLNDNMHVLDLLEQTVASENPGIRWIPTTIKVEEAAEKIFIPAWNGWAIFDHMDMLDDLLVRCTNRLSYFVKPGTKICALTQPSLFLLGKLDDWLRVKGIVVFPFDKRFPIPKEWLKSKPDLILFDIDVNTGKTMRDASKFFTAKGWVPKNYLSLLHNDLVPPTHFHPPVDDWSQRFSTIYLASVVIRKWTKNQDRAQALLQIKDAFENRRPWTDPSVKESLNLLHSRPIEGKRN